MLDTNLFKAKRRKRNAKKVWQSKSITNSPRSVGASRMHINLNKKNLTSVSHGNLGRANT